MTNLEQKFTALEQQLGTQHTELMQRLGETNIKLDSLIAAGGGAPAPGQTTLADVVSVLNDIHTDTMSMDAKLLWIRDVIAPMNEGLPTGAKTSIAWSLYRLMDAVAPAWPRPTSVPLQPNLELVRTLLEQVMGLDSDADNSLLHYISKMYNGLGLPFQALTLGELLWQNIQATTTLAGPKPPTTGGPDCSSPINTAQSVIGEVDTSDPEVTRDFSKYVFGVWNPMPNTIRASTFWNGVPAGAEVRPLSGATWQGWKIFVYSSAANYLENPTQTLRYATNTWRDVGTSLGQDRPIAPCVPADETIAVYLCPPVGGVIACIEAAGAIVKVSSYTSTRMMGVWWRSGVPQITESGGATYSNLENLNIFLPGNYRNWTLKNTSSVEVRVYKTAANVASPMYILPAGTSQVINTDTEYIIARQPANSAFTMEVCPP